MEAPVIVPSPNPPKDYRPGVPDAWIAPGTAALEALGQLFTALTALALEALDALRDERKGPPR